MSKSKLLEEGARQLLVKGYNATGIHGLLAEVGVPKGSFYHYFDSKEDFGLQVIDRSRAVASERRARFLSGDGSAAERLTSYFDALARGFEDAGFTGGCLFGTLAQEMADRNEPMRRVLAETFEAWAADLAVVLAEHFEERGIAANADEAASFLLGAWEGALVQTKALKSDEPIRLFFRFALEPLLR